MIFTLYPPANCIQWVKWKVNFIWEWKTVLFWVVDGLTENCKKNITAPNKLWTMWRKCVKKEEHIGENCVHFGFCCNLLIESCKWASRILLYKQEQFAKCGNDEIGSFSCEQKLLFDDEKSFSFFRICANYKMRSFAIGRKILQFNSSFLCMSPAHQKVKRVQIPEFGISREFIESTWNETISNRVFCLLDKFRFQFETRQIWNFNLLSKVQICPAFYNFHFNIWTIQISCSCFI